MGFLPALAGPGGPVASQLWPGGLPGHLRHRVDPPRPAGHWLRADRIGRRYLVVFGPIITALAMSALGLVDSYHGLLVALVIGSIGNAFFHPVACLRTGTISRGRGTAMAP